MFELNTLKIIIVSGLILFALCLVALVVLCKKLKAGKMALEQGWEKYNAGQKRYDEGLKQYEAGKKQLKEGWNKYNENDKLYIRLFFRSRFEEGYRRLQDGERRLSEGKKQLKDGRQKLENGYLQLQNGEKIYKKFVRIRFWLVVFCAIIAVVDLVLIGFVFLA